MLTRPLILGLSVLTALSTCLVPSGVSAQVVPNGSLTPQQQQALYLRALQMRGRGQIKTGYPQDVQMGPQAGGSAQSEQPQDTTQKNSSQKRIEARKAREEQKRAARDEAQAKKAKAVKKPIKEAPGKVDKKPAKDLAAKPVKQPKKAEDDTAAK